MNTDGLADNTDAVAKTVKIETAEQLAAFAAAVNAGATYAGYTVTLGADIYLDNKVWTPIGDCVSGKYFQGTFDGQGNTIYGLYVDNSEDESQYSTSGLFGWVDKAKATIKNLNIDGATVKGSHWVGAIAGYFTGTIENCSVNDSIIIGYNVNDDANGDKVGGIVGCLNEHSYLNNNTVVNSTITGNRDIGGIAGSVAKSTIEMKNNKVEETVITYGTTKDYGSAGAIVSGRTGYTPDNTNVATDVLILHAIATTEELAVALNAGETEITLTAGNFELPSTIAGKTVTIMGSGDATVLDFTKAYNVGNASITFKNLKIQGQNANIMNGFGIQHTTGDIVYENCTLDGAITHEYSGTVTYKNCTFTGMYYIATYALKTATFENCVFDKDDSRAVLVYSHGDNPVDVTLTGCTFKAAAKATTWAGDWTAAVEVDTTNIPTAGTTVTITNCSADTNYSGIVRDKSASGKANAVITIDGEAFVAPDDKLNSALDSNGDLAAGSEIDLSYNMTVSTKDTNSESSYGATGVAVNGGTFDGNGNVLTVLDANDTWDCAINMKSGTVKNLTINSGFRGIFMGGATGDVYIDNVILDGTVYTFNSDDGNKEYGVYISNSTLNGWTSHSDVHKEVVYTNCSFGEGNGYAFCRPYGPTTFKNCVFEEGFEFDTSKASSITFINCYYGDTLITADNAAALGKGDTTFFYNGIGNATIK